MLALYRVEKEIYLKLSRCGIKYNYPQTKLQVVAGLFARIGSIALNYIKEDMMYLLYLLDVGLIIVQVKQLTWVHSINLEKEMITSLMSQQCIFHMILRNLSISLRMKLY